MPTNKKKFYGYSDCKSKAEVMTKEEIEEKMLEVREYLSKMNDYVVETGENEKGKYIKWSSGRLEMWGEKTFKNININNRANTGVYGYNSQQQTIEFPIASTERCKITMTDYSNTGAWISGSTGGTNQNKSSVAFWFYLNQQSEGGTHLVDWRAEGRWK